LQIGFMLGNIMVVRRYHYQQLPFMPDRKEVSKNEAMALLP
jgi:hypothetical protein